MYREASPPPELREHVAAVWARRGVPNGSPPLRVVPDGSADIIWRDDGRSVTTFSADPPSVTGRRRSTRFSVSSVRCAWRAPAGVCPTWPRSSVTRTRPIWLGIPAASPASRSLPCFESDGETAGLVEVRGAGEQQHVVAARVTEVLQLVVQMIRSGEDVGARGTEELIAVVMVDVLVGGRVGVGSEAEVATDDDPRLFGAACVRPGRPGRGDTAEQGIEAEQRSNPAAAEPGHPLKRTRG